MIKLLLARVMETVFNTALSLDPKTSKWLQEHSGKVIKLVLTDLNQAFFFVIEPSKFYIYSTFTDNPTTSITGSSFAFTKQLLSKETNQTDLLLDGDIELAQSLQLFLKNLDLNWEELLSQVIGDIGAHTISESWRKVKESSAHFVARGVEDLREFIQEEKRFLPTREEIEDFYEDITQLRQAIDRLEARYMRIEGKPHNGLEK